MELFLGSLVAFERLNIRAPKRNNVPLFNVTVASRNDLVESNKLKCLNVVNYSIENSKSKITRLAI